MEESIGQAAKWSHSGRPMRVSVNVSPRQLVDRDLLATIDHALDQNGLKPELLVVEVTERAMIAERSDMARTLIELAERGIAIAIDDFGTGHSSITHLKSLPVDSVKIDRSFTAGIGRSGADFAMTAAMVQMCKALGKTVIAEGVETSSQLELLQDLGCDQAQGYLFSPAIHDLEPPSSEDSWIRLALDRT
jgi:EAL domain-containing protein (putative c-di-GMP-specific phosphodiesterase class I)